MAAADEIQVSVEDFRGAFPEFSDASKYPDSLIENFIGQAECYISPKKRASIGDDCLKLAILLMAAHLLVLSQGDASGSGGASSAGAGQVSSATIGNVSVGYVAPPNKNQTQWWLNLTPYGQRLYQLMISRIPAGAFYFGTFQRVYWGNVRGLGRNAQ